MSALVFVDIESTGLDHNEPRAQILELALVAVDPRSLVELAHWTTPINAPIHPAEWHPRVQQMHQDSGLLGELQGPRSVLKFDAGGLPHLHEAEAVACAFMAAFAPGQFSPMCGANVGSFDRQWLRKFMPKLDACFHYRALDTNGAFLVDQYVFGLATEKPVCTHRALDDARQSVATLRGLAGTLWSAYNASGRLST